jgi:hypothetical protein
MTALMIVLLLAALFFLQSFLYDRLWGKGLEAKISFREEYATEDDTAALTEVIVNNKLLPLPVVEIDFHMDKGLRFSGEENTAVSDRSYRRDVFTLGVRQKITRTLEFQCARRGYYRIDQAGMDVRNLLLTKKYVGSSPQDTDFYVLPRMVPTQRIQIPFSRIMGSVLSRKKVYDDPFEFAGLRDYTRGDPMKYINWKASAKTGDLLVNIHESTLSQKVAVVVDLEGLGVQQADLLNARRLCGWLAPCVSVCWKPVSRWRPGPTAWTCSRASQWRCRRSPAQGAFCPCARLSPVLRRTTAWNLSSLSSRERKETCCAYWSPGTSGKNWRGTSPSVRGNGSGFRSCPTVNRTRNCPSLARYSVSIGRLEERRDPF